MDQPKPPPEVWVVAVVSDPEEAIRRPGHERKDRSQIRRKSRAKKVRDLQKKKKILCHRVKSGHNPSGGCGIMLQCIREQTVNQHERRRDGGL